MIAEKYYFPWKLRKCWDYRAFNIKQNHFIHFHKYLSLKSGKSLNCNHVCSPESSQSSYDEVIVISYFLAWSYLSIIHTCDDRWWCPAELNAVEATQWKATANVAPASPNLVHGILSIKQTRPWIGIWVAIMLKNMKKMKSSMSWKQHTSVTVELVTTISHFSHHNHHHISQSSSQPRIMKPSLREITRFQGRNIFSTTITC